MASFLASAILTGYGGAGGSEIIPCISRMYISYQSPAPSLPGGRFGGPPEAAGVPLPFEEAGPPLWRGVDDFPLCLGAAVILLWPEVDGRLPWLGVGSCQPGGGRPEQQVLKSEEPVPSTSQSTLQVQEQISEASNTNSDGADEPPPERELPRRSLKVRLHLKLLKRGHQTTASSSKDGVTPSKVWKETEADEAEVGTLTGPSETALQKARFELYQKDLPAVQEVRAQILELQEGEVVTQQVLDSSPTFHLRQAADETRAPTVIGEHWIDHLDAGGHIAKCKPHDFKFEDKWLPLYTRARVTRHVSGLSSLLKTQGDSPLITVVPPDMLFWSYREYVIHKRHEEDCLSRVTIYYGENLQKQIAFCPYCGVTNENTATAYSHVRKHLGITFLCGGCYTKLYKVPQHLSQHMKTCPPCLMNRPEGSRRSVRKK